MAVYSRSSFIAPCKLVKIMPTDQVPITTNITGNDDQLKCWVGNLTAYIRSRLIAARLNIDATPNKMSSRIKYL